MNNKISTTIRCALTMVLLCGVYTETGIWTFITLFLMSVSIEIGSQLDRINTKNLKKIAEMLL